MPRVSIIIPTYNRGDLIIQSIDSVLAQTYKDYEAIIVDDGSTDNTREVIRSLLAAQNIRYLYQYNQKQAAARNNGIRMSHGEYIAFLDSDDLWHPEKLAVQVKILDEMPEIGMVYSNQSIIGDKSAAQKMKYPPGVLKSGRIFEDLLRRRYYCSTPGLLIRRSVLNDVGVFDESLGNALEDWDLTLRIALKYPVFCVDKPLFQRRLHNESKPFSYVETRINNHQRILARYLDHPESIISRSQRMQIWARARLSWGRTCFENRHYIKALKYLFASITKAKLT